MTPSPLLSPHENPRGDARKRIPPQPHPLGFAAAGPVELGPPRRWHICEEALGLQDDPLFLAGVARAYGVRHHGSAVDLRRTTHHRQGDEESAPAGSWPDGGRVGHQADCHAGVHSGDGCVHLPPKSMN